MQDLTKLKNKALKVIYDEWFKIIVGGAIVAVFAYSLPMLWGGFYNDSIIPSPDRGISLGSTYSIKEKRSYPIDDPKFQNGTLISLSWGDSKLTTRHAETNEIVVLMQQVVTATMSSSSGRTWNGTISQGQPFNAGNCEVGGLIMHLMQAPVRKDAEFKVRVVELSCP